MTRGFVGLSGTIVRFISGGKAQEKRGKNTICSGYFEKERRIVCAYCGVRAIKKGHIAMPRTPIPMIPTPIGPTPMRSGPID